MLTFISLCTFTDQGIRTVKDSTKRADDGGGSGVQIWFKDDSTLLDAGPVRFDCHHRSP